MPVREYVTLDQVLPFVLRDCLNVPRSVALREIRTAAIKFCRESRYWREDIVPVTTLALSHGVTEYEVFTLAPETRIVFVQSLQADGRALDALTEDELDRNQDNWRTRQGRPQKFIAPAESWVRPYPIAVDPVVLTGKAIVTPTSTGNYLLQDIFDNYGETIASLAKAKLMTMPEKPWTNPQMAVFEGELGEAAIAKARSQSSRNYAAATKRRNRAYWQ